MQINNIKLVICDVDGTLIGKDEKLSKKAIDLSKKLEKNGYLLTLASGRVEDMAEDYVKSLGIKIPYIASNGSTIADLEKVYIKKKIKMEGLMDIAKKAISLGMSLVYTQDGREFVVNETKWILKQREKFNRYHKMSSLSNEELSKIDIDKLMIMDEVRDGKIQIIEDMAKKLNGDYSYTRYTDKSVEFVSKDSTKASALIELCKILKISMDQVLAIGDHINDIEMIQEAGIGACVNNGKDELKKVSDYVSSFDQIDGVVDICNKFLNLSRR